MSPALHRPLIMLSLAAFTAPVQAQSTSSHLPAWLAGCWQQRTGDTVVDEQWLAPRGGILLGAARTTRGDSLVDFEFMRIRMRGDTLVFVAQPSGQAPAEFVARRHAAREIVFENLAHDFPQRVIYRAAPRDSLHARIEGTIGGQARGKDFRYARSRCAPAQRMRGRR